MYIDSTTPYIQKCMSHEKLDFIAILVNDTNDIFGL